jgi:hypothetical protein
MDSRANAAETANAFRAFISTGDKKHLDMFFKNVEEFGNKRKDQVFVRELGQRLRTFRLDPAIDNIIKTFEGYQKSLVKPPKEYPGLNQLQLASAVAAVYGDFRKYDFKAATASRAFSQPDQASRMAFEDFVYACREGEFGRTKQEERIAAAKPATPHVLRTGRAEELRKGLMKAPPALISLDISLRNLEAIARGKPDLEVLVKGYRKDLERLAIIAEQVFESRDPTEAAKRLDHLNLGLKDLDAKIRSAKKEAKSAPPHVLKTDRAEELRKGLMKAESDLVTLDRSLRALEAFANTKGVGPAFLREDVKGYRKDFEHLARIPQQAMEAKDLATAARLLNQLNLGLKDLEAKIRNL